MKEIAKTVYVCENCGKEYDTRIDAMNCETSCAITIEQAIVSIELLKRYCGKHDNNCEYKGKVCGIYDECPSLCRDIGGFVAL